MITFTDPRLYTRGICAAQFADMETGQVMLSSNKFQEGNITVTVNADPLRAGLNNGIATIIESDPDIQVNFTQANFDLRTKMAGVGGAVTYNAVAPVCQVVTANSTVLKVDVTDGAPWHSTRWRSPMPMCRRPRRRPASSRAASPMRSRRTAPSAALPR